MIAIERSKGRELLLLSLCGLLSMAIYWGAFVAPYNLYSLSSQGATPDLGVITGYSQLACWRYVGALVLLFGLYAWGARLTGRSRGRGATWIVAGYGLASALLLTQVYPYAASDVFLYIVRGRVLGIYGHNPLLVPPSAFPTEPYLPFPSEWVNVSSPYAPLWEWTAAGLARLGDGSLLRSLLAFKGWGLLSYTACTGVLAAILHAQKPEQLAQRLLLFAWNPLVLLEAHAMAHNDLYMVCFVLLALWLWEHRRYPWTIASLVMGGLVKYVPFLLLPPTLALLWARLGRRAWLHAVRLATPVSAALIAATLGPLWPGPAGLGVIGQLQRFHHSVATWVILILSEIIPQSLALEAGLWFTRISFVIAYLIVLLHSLRHSDSLACTYFRLLYVWLCLGVTGFGYWYISWLVALLPLLESGRARFHTILFSFCGLLSVAIYTFGIKLGPSRSVHLVAVPFVFLSPLLMAFIYDRIYHKIHHRGQSPALARHSHA